MVDSAMVFTTYHLLSTTYSIVPNLSSKKHVVVVGANGAIGRILCRYLDAAGYSITAVVRNPDKARTVLPEIPCISLDFRDPTPLITALRSAVAVCNLSGAPLLVPFAGHTHAQAVRESRVTLTTRLVQLLEQCQPRPAVFLNASAGAFYGTSSSCNTPLTESSPPGKDPLARLVQEWEAAALQAERLGIRTVLLRPNLVLEPSRNGFLERLSRPFHCFVGGPLGNPLAWYSWIAGEDAAGLIVHALENQAISGPLNLTAPEPVTHAAFAKALSEVLHRPSWLRIPEPLLTLVYGENARVITRGQPILPGKALATGYVFQFPTLDLAVSR